MAIVLDKLKNILCFIFLLSIKTIGLVPFIIRSWIGWIIGFIWGLLPLRDQKLTRLQGRLFLKEHRKLFVPLVFGSVGRTILETLNLRPILKNHQKYIVCENWRAAEDAIKEGKGIIAFSSHTGNWDLLAAYCVARGVNLTAIGREARNPFGQVLLEALREINGVRSMWRSKRALVKEIMSLLKNNGIVAALIDQDTRVAGIFTNFFGYPAHTPHTFASLAIKLEAPIFAGFVGRTNWGSHYKVNLTRLDPSDGVAGIIKQYNQLLEQHIRNFPTQWVWFHKRWRTKVDGYRMSSSEYREWLEENLSLSINNN